MSIINCRKNLFLAALAICGCNNNPEFRQYYFTGRVYDGATGDRLTNYKLDLQYLNHHLSAKVDSEGRYVVGKLSAFNDYTIEIVADGYRTFLSHNQMKVGEPFVHDGESFYYDAYLFPVDLKSPAANINITQSDSTALPSGTIRFRATSGSILEGTNTPNFPTTTDTPAGVLNQVWGNDEDLQFRTVTKQFTNGLLQLAEGDLVYGVNYDVNIYGVPGHADFNSGTYQPGVSGDASYVVNPTNFTPLRLAFLSTDLNVPVPNGEVVLVFNQPIEFDPTSDTKNYIESVDTNFALLSPDYNGNTNGNVLKDNTLNTNDHGIMITITDDTMKLDWGQAAALKTSDSGDPILSVTYGGLDGVLIRPKNGSDGTTVSLDTVTSTAGVPLGNSITVQVTATPPPPP